MTHAPRRPALRYHGGKWRLAKWVIGHFPPHRVYVEPYCGAASVLMQKPRSFGEIINDLDDEVVNVFRVLRDPELAGQLEANLRLTPFARSEFTLAYEPVDPADVLERARRTIVKAFMGFGSDAIHRPAPRGMRTAVSTSRSRAFKGGGTGFRTWSRQNGATPARDFATWPDEIPAFVARLRGVAIENRPAIEVVDQHIGNPDVLFYVDPPYLKSVRQTADRNGYKHEMTDDDHRELAARLHEHNGPVIISGYPSELYDEELFADWRRETKDAYADAKVKSRTEVLWLNEAAASHGQIAMGLK